MFFPQYYSGLDPKSLPLNNIYNKYITWIVELCELSGILEPKLQHQCNNVMTSHTHFIIEQLLNNYV